MKITLDTRISAPRSIVFARVMDIPNWPGVISAIEEIELLTPGPISVGTKYSETRVMFGHQASEEMTIREIIQDKKIVLTAKNHGTDYAMEYLFEDADRDTRLTLVFTTRPQTPIALLMTPISWIMAGSMRKIIATDLADLKSAIEKPT